MKSCWDYAGGDLWFDTAIIALSNWGGNMPYWRLYCHLVWSTRYRAPVLLGPSVEVVRKVVWGVSKELGIKIHALSVQPDHVHIALSAGPSQRLSDIIQRYKGSSSYQLGRLDDSDWVGWQTEYGIVGFGQQSLSRVVAYVNNQEAHHRKETLLGGTRKRHGPTLESQWDFK